MKRFVWLVLLTVAAIFGGQLFPASDIAQLQPIQVIRVDIRQDQVLVQTDTDAAGMGANLAAAFEDLKCKTAGDIFLDTADYVLVTQRGSVLLPQLLTYLRPACRVCLERGQADLKLVAKYLMIHDPEYTLMQYAAEKDNIPVLICKEGSMELVS